MSGGRDQDEQVYIKDVNNVVLGPLVVDPDGEYLYFVEKKRHKFIRLSLKSMLIYLASCPELPTSDV